VKTFSIGFEDEDYSEVGFARMVAKRYATDHHEFIVKPEALEVLPLLVRHFGEPFGDSSAIPTYYVSKVTRQHVTVALNGDGGDESFAGYERYVANRLITGLRKLPRPLLDIPAMALDIFPEQTGQAPFLRRVKRVLHYARAEGDMSYFRMMTIFEPDDRYPLYTPEFRAKVGATDPWDYLRRKLSESDARDPIDRMLALDATSYLPEDLLPKVDIASMAHALETRSPLLDHELMEFAARLPGSMKLDGRKGKKILKKVLHAKLPPEITTRRKMGFGVPVGGWFRGPMKEYIREHLLDGRARSRGYFAAEPLERLLAEHISGRRDHGYRLYALLQLELWHRAFMDPRP
jgi:asparagine synthase (glutamine-hydrolysing)